jgi:hypothetical protein
MFRKCLLILALGLVPACAGPPAAPPADAPPPPQPPRADAPRTEPAETGQPIRSVDFANFSYSWPEAQVRHVGERGFTLAEGARVGRIASARSAAVWSVYFNSVEYADLSGDGVEEAVVLLHLLPDNEVSDYAVYVFELERHRPRPVGCLLATDRGPGAFQRLAVEDGRLVVELAGDGAAPRDELDPSEARTPTPDAVTRSRFEVRAGALRLVDRQTLARPG